MPLLPWETTPLTFLVCAISCLPLGPDVFPFTLSNPFIVSYPLFSLIPLSTALPPPPPRTHSAPKTLDYL